MKIGVLVKTVHFLYAQTGTDISKNFISDNDYLRLVNPLDEVAIEYALQLKEKLPEATVSIIGYGEEAEQYSCRHGIAMGADRAVVLKGGEQDLFNPYVVSQSLSSVCEPEQLDVILSGADSIDTGSRLEAQFLAERMSIAHLSNIVAIAPKENTKTLTVERLIEGGNRQLMECDTPILLTIAKSNITPRYPTLAGSLLAEESTIESVNSGSQQAAGQDEAGSMQLQSLLRPVPGRQNGTAALAQKEAEERVLFMIEGDTSSAQGGGVQVQGGSTKMFKELGTLLSQAGLTETK